jgi:hypothetical protein
VTLYESEETCRSMDIVTKQTRKMRDVTAMSPNHKNRKIISEEKD